MRRLQAAAAILGLVLVSSPARSENDDTSRAGRVESPSKPEPAADEVLSTTPAVACRSIAGYEDYEILPDASLTAEEKLLVYYRPLNYRVEKVAAGYHAHMTQDGQIRRRGGKAVLLRKMKLLDYEFTTKEMPNPVFLRNTVALKGLKPGDYEYDIILHDMLGQGETVTRTLAFKIVPVVLPGVEAEPSPDASAPETRARPNAKRTRKSAPRSQRP